ncbi:hypothetical protein [Ramlibacter montanisoli]|uniref:hypothetical protein n=1 Tax=Ramlibacter montanisoli TaxID=2732512 RepID=UPI00209C6BE9|nr:hypothetical protein [Ramlibacter montanisoli]
MDRRSFIGTCTAGAAGLSAAATFAALAANARPKEYAKALLVNERGDALKASELKVQANYVFHYPFEATPVFLLDLGKAVAPNTLSTQDRNAYSWPGGVGRNRSIVAFSAICAHQLVYPTRDVSFISFRKTRAARRAGRPDPLLRGAQPVRSRARRGGARARPSSRCARCCCRTMRRRTR